MQELDRPLNSSEETGLSFQMLPPGASQVVNVRNRGTEWYCEHCESFIGPIWVRCGKYVYPSCRECFFDDLPVFKTDIGPAVEDKDVGQDVGTDSGLDVVKVKADDPKVLFD
jgi:hypothetical protein